MLLRTYIVDSAVLTDLETAGFLLEAGLPMPFRLAVGDFIRAYGESEKHDTRELEEIGFTIESLDEDEMDLAVRLCGEHLELSLPDVTALTLCMSRGYALLARNPQLLAASRNPDVVGDRDVRAHGTLWLLDQLATHGRLSPWEAVRAVRTMQAHGRRLNQRACDKFVEKWDRPSQ